MSLEVISFPARNSSPQASVVMLHGWGANAQDVAALASYMNLPQVQFYFPNAPFAFPYSEVGRMWYNLPADYSFQNQLNPSQQSQVSESRQQLLSWLQSLPDSTGIPLSRTVLAGFSQGGAMTLEVGLQLPLAALMVLSGYAHAPLALADPAADPAPVLMVHGRSDLVVPLIAAQQTRANLTQLKLPVQYHELEMGHEIQPLVLKLMQSFIEETMFST